MSFSNTYLKMSQTMSLTITDLSTRAIVPVYMEVIVPNPFPCPYVFRDNKYEYWYEPPCNCMDCWLSRCDSERYIEEYMNEHDETYDLAEDEMDNIPEPIDIKEDMISDPFDDYMDEYGRKILIRQNKGDSKKKRYKKSSR